MVGHDAVRQGITWGIGTLERPRFAVRHVLAGTDHDDLAALEVDTNHELVGGAAVTFTQVFVGELDGDGRFRRVQSYTPYPPPPVP